MTKPEQVKEALEAARECLELAAKVPFVDSDYGARVDALGAEIGFGALMSSASRSWRDRLDTPGGEFVCGPCRITAEAALNKVNAALASLTEGGEAEPEPVAWNYDLDAAPADKDFEVLYASGEIRIGFVLDNSGKQFPWKGVRSRYGAERVGDKIVAWRHWPRTHASRGDGELAAAERAGFDAAIKFIRDRRDAYVEEHGNYDWSTGATEFPGNGSDTVGEWDELIEEIEALRDAALSRRPADEGRAGERVARLKEYASNWRADAGDARPVLDPIAAAMEAAFHEGRCGLRSAETDWLESDAFAALSPATGDGAGRAVGETFQQRVQPWMMACFGPEISADKLERNDRFIEEALELVQASEYPRERALALVDYVYGRDQGEINQEVGGVMVTLAAHCLAHGVDMHAAAETELARIWTKVDQIRAKQKAKPTGSALPVVPAPSSEGGA